MDPNKPTEEFLRSIDIHTLLPQQEPFVMVDTLVRFDERFVVTQTRVREDNLFVEGQHFSAPGLIENIAQTCAAKIGYVNKYILKKGIRVGLIGAIRDLQVLSLPKVGNLLRTEVETVEEVFGMTLAHARVECNGKILAQTQIKIAIEKEEE